MLFMEMSEYFALKARDEREAAEENFHLDSVPEDEQYDPELDKGILDIVSRQAEIDEFLISTK